MSTANKSAHEILQEIANERRRLESEAKALRKVEVALKARHRPRPPRKRP